MFHIGLHHLRALQLLYLCEEISRQAMKVVRDQLVSAKNEDEMEGIMRKVIRNVGKRHKRVRQGGGLMEMRLMRLADLFPADYNPRKALKRGGHEYEKLRQSIETFGLVEPLIWNEATGRLVGSHQRLTVLKDMGIIDSCQFPGEFTVAL